MDTPRSAVTVRSPPDRNRPPVDPYSCLTSARRTALADSRSSVRSLTDDREPRTDWFDILGDLTDSDAVPAHCFDPSTPVSPVLQEFSPTRAGLGVARVSGLGNCPGRWNRIRDRPASADDTDP
ncbi:hypothetical protein C478_17756 [Natrinema thermotolerans DSM 11552]|nr:hypothetical protein C478_17756 [Natrinema thermotolerans DSM 11552]